MPVSKIATAVALCALAVGAQALTPASAAAMTNEEWAGICSAAAELGSSVRCVTDTTTGSGSGTASSPSRPYGPTGPSHEVIVIVEPKPLEPATLECGWGIQATRRVDCDVFKRKQGYDWIDARPPFPRGRAMFPYTGRAQCGPAAPASRPSGTCRKPGKRAVLKACVEAATVLREARGVGKYLNVLLENLSPAGKLTDETFRQSLVFKATEWRARFGDEVWSEILVGSLTDPERDLSEVEEEVLVHELKTVWDSAVEEAKETVKAPYCLKPLNAGKSQA